MTATALAVAPPDGLPRLLAGVRGGAHAGLAEHLAAYGAPGSAAGLIEELEAAGLRGRGGGSFPTGTKLAAVRARRGRPIVVANGAEGEPASAKDRLLLRCLPHLVLDGAAAAAAALGAREVVVAVAQTARAEQAALAAAVAERRERLRWRIALVPEAFVAGEETALLAAVAGGAPRPTTKPPYPFERGLGGAPTLVQNVETLAHVALIARYGAAWFRGLGTPAEPGTALVTLQGAVARPGVYEIELGTTVAEVVQAAGGPTGAVEAFLVGGYFGRWTRDPQLRLTAAHGLGAGVVVALPASTCPLAETARVARYLAASSAGQCGPCVHGLAAIAGALEDLVHGGRTEPALRRWAGQVTGRGACRHPDGAAKLVAGALEIFGDDVKRHARGGCGRPDLQVLPS